jgi:hypothetical protein
LNTDLTGGSPQDGTSFVTVLVSLNRKMRVIKIGEEDARPYKVDIHPTLYYRHCSVRPDNRFRGEHNLSPKGSIRLCCKLTLLCST